MNLRSYTLYDQNGSETSVSGFEPWETKPTAFAACSSFHTPPLEVIVKQPQSSCQENTGISASAHACGCADPGREPSRSGVSLFSRVFIAWELGHSLSPAWWLNTVMSEVGILFSRFTPLIFREVRLGQLKTDESPLVINVEIHSLLTTHNPIFLQRRSTN